MRLTDEQLALAAKWAEIENIPGRDWMPCSAGDLVLDLIREVQERRADAVHTWETVYDGPATKVLRFRVAGGWLYQIAECDDDREAWHPPVFVPERLEFLHPDGRVTP